MFALAGGAALIVSGEVVERVPIEIGAQPENLRYLQTKRVKLGHSLSD